MWTLMRPDAASIIKDDKCKRSLARYFDIFQNKRNAKFLVSKKLEANFSEDDSVDELWKSHEDLLKEYLGLEKKVDDKTVNLDEIESPEKSFLDLKIEIAKQIVQRCELCERYDRPNRLVGQLGFCKCGQHATVSTYFEHMGEEPELVPSGTIFTCGCTLRCLHCQNWTISQWFETGEIYTPRELAKVVDELRRSGCRNANLVGGEPTPWLQQWLETFSHVTTNVPIVWNSNTYYSQLTARLLAGFADVYLLDFKYGPGDCAERISSAPKYWDACTRNHLIAKQYGELIIRVLVLPEHLECCTKPIVHWIASNLGKSVRVNIMFQYRPEWRAHEIPELRRRLTHEERNRAVELAKEAGLDNFIT